MAWPAITVCDAIAAGLNGETFSEVFTASSVYVPKWTTRQLSELRVTVFPEAIEDSESLGRGGQTADRMTLYVAFQKKAESRSEQDAISGLAQEVRDWLKVPPQRSAFGAAYENGVTTFDPEHLANYGVMSAFIQLTYRVFE